MIAWLKRNLTANEDNKCTLAYFHHSLFSSGGEHGNQPAVRPIWKTLYAANADVVVSGHDHGYERFAPQKPDGTRDRERGIRLRSWWCSGRFFVSCDAMMGALLSPQRGLS